MDTRICSLCKRHRPQTGSSCSVWPRLEAVFTCLALLNLSVAQTIESEAFIKVTRFHVPPEVRAGEQVRLLCEYEISGETLHAMKLFKDNQEFYRFTPTETRKDQRMAFKLPGVRVLRGTEREVLLDAANQDTAGNYKCQVSVEHTFRSISAERRLDVVPKISNNGLDGQTESQRAPVAGSSRQQQQRHAASNQKQYPQQQQQRQRTAASSMQPTTKEPGSSADKLRPNQLVRIATTLITFILVLTSQRLSFGETLSSVGCR